MAEADTYEVERSTVVNAPRVMGIFSSMDKVVGPDFDKGLARLKSAAER